MLPGTDMEGEVAAVARRSARIRLSIEFQESPMQTP
jgi:hypothetical protein